MLPGSKLSQASRTFLIVSQWYCATENIIRTKIKHSIRRKSFMNRLVHLTLKQQHVSQILTFYFSDNVRDGPGMGKTHVGG